MGKKDDESLTSVEGKRDPMSSSTNPSADASAIAVPPISAPKLKLKAPAKHSDAETSLIQKEIMGSSSVDITK